MQGVLELSVCKVGLTCHYFIVLCQLALLNNRVRIMVLNANLSNISAISWRPDLLVEETEVPVINHQTFASHIMLYRVHLV
jgi:hypothetical protein